jgi:hypothetical protein
LSLAKPALGRCVFGLKMGHAKQAFYDHAKRVGFDAAES